MKKFDINYTNDIEEIYNKIIFQTKNYFEKYAFKRAVLGLSGGLDSTICATILVDILGKENVYGIFLPSKITTNESRIDAQMLAQNLGINYFEMPISPVVDELSKTASSLFEKISAPKCKISYTNDNFQARARANIIWAVANEFEATIPIATSDKSEFYMGYATINGDMSGGFCPIADVLKTQLFALANWMNENREKKNAIPKNIISKPPTAELAINEATNAPLKAEEALMPYPFMDEVIFRLEELNQNFQKIMNEAFYFETSKEQKRAWLEKFAKRVNGAVFKWGLIPEIAVISEKSLNKKEHFEELKSRFVF